MEFTMIDGTIPVWGTPDEGAVSQIRTCAKTAHRLALMGDHHKGYAVPIGGVVAYKGQISPSGVGYDIGCGNKAVRLDNITGADIRPKIASIMDEIWRTISFGIGQKNNTRVDHTLFDSDTWKLDMLKPLKQMAQSQLGTIGSGNHYVDIFVDELDRVWVGVHFGSRGLGHKTATWFLEAAGAKDGMDVEPCVIDVDTALGSDYIAAMQLAGDYAYAGRDWVCEAVAGIIGAPIVEEIHNHHNFAWQENHGGEDLWVVRKGATPAFPGQKGFVGGTMTENAVILQGATPEIVPGNFTYGSIVASQQDLGMFSTVHGAGRVMGRMAAKGKVSKAGVVTREGLVSQDMMNNDVAVAGVELRGAGVDESSFCYKRLPEVLANHAATVDILHTLTPIGVAMAGSKEFDPYKD